MVQKVGDIYMYTDRVYYVRLPDFKLLLVMQSHQFILLDLQDTVYMFIKFLIDFCISQYYINTYLTFTHTKIVLDLHQFY